MYKYILTTALLLSGASSAAEPLPLSAPLTSPPVEQSWLEVARKDAQETGNTLDENAFRMAVSTNELLSAEARRLGMDQQPDFAIRLEMKRTELLANLVIRDYMTKNPPTEEMLMAEYERIKAQSGNKEYSARHIQLKTEDEAQAVIAQLAKRGDFAKLAKEKSQDMSTRDKGGQIGWLTKNLFRPPLGNALSKLQKGLYTTIPVQTEAGWHVLKLEGVRDFKMPGYDKIKEPLRQRLKSQLISQYIDSLRTRRQP